MTDMITVSRKEIEDWINRNQRWAQHSACDGDLVVVAQDLRALLDKAEVSEPVADAINERSRLGYTVVKVIGKLDEIIENTQEVEIDDFLHIAVPIDMWGELQESLEDMPKRAYLYTSPPDQSAKIAELEAREKVLVEALDSIAKVNHSRAKCGAIAHQALANVNIEKRIR